MTQTADIKAEELRLGNKIYMDDLDISTGKWHQKIIDVGYRDIYNLINGNDMIKESYQGIPITKDWLFNFGFECRLASTCIKYYIGKNKITHDWLFSLTWLDKPELINEPDVPFYRNGGHYVYFVHQLQNLYFALTKEELIVRDKQTKTK